MEGSTGRLRVTDDTFTKWLCVPVPPIVEQRSIVRILEVVDTAIERTRTAIDKAKRLKKGLTQNLIPSGRFPKSWQVFPLREIAEVGSGVTLGKNLEGSSTVRLPYLRVENVQDGFLDLTTIKQVKVRTNEVERYLLQPGDVLMTEGGDLDKLGRGCVWHGEITPCLHQNHIFRVRPNNTILDPDYLEAVICSSYGKRYFMRIAKRTTNLASINKTQLKAFFVPCPSLDEQRRIVEILSAAQTRINAEENHCAIFNRLKRGLMQDLLTGKVRVGNGVLAAKGNSV